MEAAAVGGAECLPTEAAERLSRTGDGAAAIQFPRILRPLGRTLPRESFTQVIAPLVIESTKGLSVRAWSEFPSELFWTFELRNERDRAIHPIGFQRRQSFVGLVEGKCCHRGLKMDLCRQVKEIPSVGASHVGHAA